MSIFPKSNESPQKPTLNAETHSLALNLQSELAREILFSVNGGNCAARDPYLITSGLHGGIWCCRQQSRPTSKGFSVECAREGRPSTGCILFMRSAETSSMRFALSWFQIGYCDGTVSGVQASSRCVHFVWGRMDAVLFVKSSRDEEYNEDLQGKFCL